MKSESLLDGKRILIVDDEPDVLESLIELLPMCQVLTALSFKEGKKLLETRPFDMAILDVMGVDGYKLLEIANERDVIAVMLTAHAKSPDQAAKSYKEGAASYLPKDKMRDIEIFLSDVLEAKKRGKDTWWRWLLRLADFWKNEFGPSWERGNEEFLSKLRKL